VQLRTRVTVCPPNPGLGSRILLTPLLYLIAFFEATCREYYDRLSTVTAGSAWGDWLEYFLNGVARMSDDALSRTERITVKVRRADAMPRRPRQDATVT
jgi:hypothetical protein